MIGEVHTGGVASEEWTRDPWALQAGELAVRQATMVSSALEVRGDEERLDLERSLKALDIISRASWPSELGDQRQATEAIVAHYEARSISHSVALAIADGVLRVPSQTMPVRYLPEQTRQLEGHAKMAMSLIASGGTMGDIAAALKVSEIGAQAVCKDARKMLRADNMPMAVRNAYQADWLRPPAGTPGALLFSRPPVLEIGLLRNRTDGNGIRPALTNTACREAVAIALSAVHGDWYIDYGGPAPEAIKGTNLRILSHMALGWDNQEIALHAGLQTVRAARYVRETEQLLGAKDRPDAVLQAFRRRLIIPRGAAHAQANT